MLLLLFTGVSGALLQGNARISVSTVVAAPVSGAALAGAAGVQFATVAAFGGVAGLAASASIHFSTAASLFVPQAFHVFYGANINKTCGLLIHAE